MDKASSSKRAIGIVWLTVFIDLIGFSIIFPIFPAMLDWYLPRLESGTLLHDAVHGLLNMTAGSNQGFLVSVLFGGFLGSLYSFLQFFASPIWGRLSDRHGRRPILLITTVGTALSYFVWIFAGGFWLLILSRMVAGIMSGNIAVATASIADLTDTKKRSKGMALIGVAFGLGFILGPAIGGLGSLIDFGVNFENTGTIGLTPFSFPALLAFILALGNFLWVWRAFPETNPVDLESKPAKEKRVLLQFGSKNPGCPPCIEGQFHFHFRLLGNGVHPDFPRSGTTLLQTPRYVPNVPFHRHYAFHHSGIRHSEVRASIWGT